GCPQDVRGGTSCVPSLPGVHDGRTRSTTGTKECHGRIEDAAGGTLVRGGGPRSSTGALRALRRVDLRRLRDTGAGRGRRTGADPAVARGRTGGHRLLLRARDRVDLA